MGMLDGVSNDRDRYLILKILLCHSQSNGSWMWSLDSHGFYTMRSTYHYLVTSFLSDQNTDSAVWKHLWNMLNVECMSGIRLKFP